MSKAYEYPRRGAEKWDPSGEVVQRSCLSPPRGEATVLSGALRPFWGRGRLGTSPRRKTPLRQGKRIQGFTLMEVMIACGIFFMATFAILALVSTTLRNARALQRRGVDAGMAAAQVFETLKTNRMEQGSLSGDFGDPYPGYTWDASWDLDWDSGATNGLLKVDIVVNHKGNRQPVDNLSIRVFAPDARSGLGQPNFR